MLLRWIDQNDILWLCLPHYQLKRRPVNTSLKGYVRDAAGYSGITPVSIPVVQELLREALLQTIKSYISMLITLWTCCSFTSISPPSIPEWWLLALLPLPYAFPGPQSYCPRSPSSLHRRNWEACRFAGRLSICWTSGTSRKQWFHTGSSFYLSENIHDMILTSLFIELLDEVFLGFLFYVVLCDTQLRLKYGFCLVWVRLWHDRSLMGHAHHVLVVSPLSTYVVHIGDRITMSVKDAYNLAIIRQRHLSLPLNEQFLR